MGGVFGSSDTQRYPSTPPEDSYEKRLRQILTNLASGAPIAEWQNRFAGESALKDELLQTVSNQNPEWAFDNLKTLSSGQLPGNYQSNMEQAVTSGANKAMGSTINDLAKRGVLNSSVTNRAMNQIGENVSNALAQGYNQSMATAGQIAQAPITNYNQLFRNVASFAPASEAWEYPYSLYELWRGTRYSSNDDYVTEKKPGLLDFASPVATIMGK